MKSVNSKELFSRPIIDHYIIECFGVSQEYTNNTHLLSQSVTSFCHNINVHIVNSFVHTFSPYGITLVMVLAESHLAVHTWPENGYLVMDIMSCQKIADYDLILNETASHFKTNDIIITKVNYN